MAGDILITSGGQPVAPVVTPAPGSSLPAPLSFPAIPPVTVGPVVSPVITAPMPSPLLPSLQTVSPVDIAALTPASAATVPAVQAPAALPPLATKPVTVADIPAETDFSFSMLRKVIPDLGDTELAAETAQLKLMTEQAALPSAGAETKGRLVKAEEDLKRGQEYISQFVASDPNVRDLVTKAVADGKTLTLTDIQNARLASLPPRPINNPALAAAYQGSIGNVLHSLRSIPTTDGSIEGVTRGIGDALDSYAKTATPIVMAQYNITSAVPPNLPIKDRLAMEAKLAKYDSALSDLKALKLDNTTQFFDLQNTRAEIADQTEVADDRREALISRNLPVDSILKLGGKVTLPTDAESQVKFVNQVGSDSRTQLLVAAHNQVVNDPNASKSDIQASLEATQAGIQQVAESMMTTVAKPGFLTNTLFNGDTTYNWSNIFASSSLALAVYGQTYGAEKARKQSLADLKDIERFRNDLAQENMNLRFQQQLTLQENANAAALEQIGAEKGSKGGVQGSVVSRKKVL